MPATKVATCCYCGSRAALVLSGRDRHELSCASCGAPLHEMKRLPARPDRADLRHAPRPGSHDVKEMPKHRGGKRRKGLGRRLFEELWDVVEDIID